MKHVWKALRDPWLAGTVAVLVLVAFLAGWVLKPGSERHSESPSAAATQEDHPHGKKQKQLWTCSMHSQIKLPSPGKCPLCGMDLIPLEGGGTQDGPRTLSMSPAAKKLAEILTAPVERRFVDAEIRMVGKVDYDETKLKTITAWVGGRLDKLYVDYTGVPVRKGDHLVYLYSPELFSAQEELLQAIKAVQDKRERGVEIDEATDMDVVFVKTAKEKLRLLGLKETQIREIEERGKPVDHLTIYAPAAGIVIHKNAVEGMYVKTGTRIYTIADLSTVWVRLDAYESDLSRLRYAQQVEFTTEAYPGEVFHGRIAFIDPVLDRKTRTVKVRVNAPNLQGKLKPEMFIRAVVRAKLAEGGVVATEDLSGKWICPMHPEVLEDEPGTCRLCEMDLVRAEASGYVSPAQEWSEPLIVPRSAVLATGKRAVVYVEVPNAEKPTYEGREIVLGPRAGDYYLVKAGLKAGEQVVVQGNFKIDSALQILAKPSMMSPPEEPAATTQKAVAGFDDVPAAFQHQLGQVFQAYLGIPKALAADDPAGAKAAAAATEDALGKVDMALLKGAAHLAWMKHLEGLKAALRTIGGTGDIQKQREGVSALSEEMVQVLERFGYHAAKPALIMECTMAFDNRGARWLQIEETVANPYYGEAMLRCGEKVDAIAVTKPKQAETRPQEHVHDEHE